MARTQDVLFVGCTRPSLVWGVTYETLIVNVVVTFVTFMATYNVFYLATFVPVHAVSYLVCASEPRRFELMRRWVATKGKNLNRRLWKSSSYSPLEPFRAEDEQSTPDKKKP